MILNRTNQFLLVAFVAVIGLNRLGQVDQSQPNYASILPDMAQSPAYGAFAPNPNFPDGKTLQPPVIGTIPHGTDAPLHFEVNDADRKRAGSELISPYQPPVAPSQAVLDRGKVVFETDCSVCHGMGGNADGLIVQHGFPAPETLLTGNLARLSDGEMFFAITYGGRKWMPSYAAQIEGPDRWKVIAYIRSLEAAAPQSTPSAPVPATTAPAKPPAPAGPLPSAPSAPPTAGSPEKRTP